MKGVVFMKNLYESIQPLREKYPHLCLSEAVVACLDHNERLEEYCKELRKENENCKAQYQHWDERYSEALIKMRGMKEEIERLKTENEWYKKLMDF
jgi:FtsZ-binding cell division protein ZapB